LLFGRPNSQKQPPGLRQTPVLRRPPCRSAQKCLVALRFSSSPGCLLFGRPNRPGPGRAKGACGSQRSDLIRLRPGHMGTCVRLWQPDYAQVRRRLPRPEFVGAGPPEFTAGARGRPGLLPQPRRDRLRRHDAV
jgi:hypothetical protein